MSKVTEIGAIQWFNKEKGFGVISTPNKDEDYFLHQSNAIDPISSFSPGTPVCFKKVIEKKSEKGIVKKRLTAVDVRLINKDDLDLIFNHVINNKYLKIQKKKTRTNLRGKTFTKSIEESESVFKVCISYLIEKSSNEDVIDLSVKFLKHLRKNDLVEQRENIKQLSKLLEPSTEEIIKFWEETIDGRRDHPSHRDLRKYVYGEIKGEEYSSLLVILWKFDFLTDHSMSDAMHFFGKDTLPFDADYLIKHHDIFNEREIKLFKYYEIDDRILIGFFKAKYVRRPLLVEDLEKVHFYITTFPSISAKCFDLISDLFDDKLIFDAWAQKKYAINLKEKEIKNLSYSEDYKIPKSLFLQFYHDIDYSLLTRIQNIYENSDDIIESLLLNIFENTNNLSEEDRYRSIQLISDEESRKKIIELYACLYFEESFPFLINNASVDFIKKCIDQLENFETSLEDLSEKLIAILSSSECAIRVDRKIELLTLFGNESLKNYYHQNINNLIDNDKLKINRVLNESESANLTLDYWNFDSSLVTIALLNSIDFDVIKPKSSFRSKLEERVKEYKSDKILRIYRATNFSFLIPHFVSKLSFQSQYELQSSLDCVKGENNLILEKFSSEYSNLSIEDFSQSLKLFSEYDLKVAPNIIHNRISNASVDELSTVFEISDELHNQYPDAFQDGFLELLKKKTSNDLPLLKLIEHSYSTKVSEKVLNLINVGEESDELIQLLIQKPVFKQLNASTIEPVLKTLSLEYFDEVIKYACEFHSSIVSNILEEISINPKNINDVLDYIDENEGVGENINESSEFSVIRNFAIEPTNEIFIEKLNQLFKKSNYSYQLPVLKYLVYIHYKNVLQKDQLIKILHRIDVVQLSSILFKAFIIEKAINREEMMRKMNLLLKAHFKIISENNISHEEYRHIFSLEGLVKMCNGRKRYTGVDLWGSGSHSRYYTNGNHRVSNGFVENMYCEGRFWKEQKFYYKESNKPTGEACDLYWCRNDVCVGINDEVDLSLDFHQWTLNELNELFDINLDRLVFTHLAGWLNRMDSIITRLKCYSCDDILRPKNYVPKKLGYYAVPLFNCINNECDKFGKPIRFTHCRGCKKILDSRECERCKNCNWLICDDEDCGKCGCGSNHTSKYVQYSN